MIDLVVNALNLLNVDEWIMRGTPKNEKEFNTMFTKVIGQNSMDSAIESSDPSKFGVTWSQIQAALADGGIVAMTELRRQRDNLLKETDWMANSDSTISDSWKKYRQDLRDLPSNNKNVSWDGVTLSNVKFPTKPTE